MTLEQKKWVGGLVFGLVIGSIISYVLSAGWCLNLIY
jgi:hypothetical protein